MAGFFGTFIIEWQCLKPHIYNEEHGFVEIMASNENDAVERFESLNPDYKVIDVKLKTD